MLARRDFLTALLAPAILPGVAVAQIRSQESVLPIRVLTLMI
jgi:hypothetical protein